MGFITFDAFKEFLKSNMATIKQYMPLSGGKLSGKLITRDLYVGGDFDENGSYDKYNGDGSSHFTVSGTADFLGTVNVPDATIYAKQLEVEDEISTNAALHVANSADIGGSLDVGNDLRVQGEMHIYEDSLHMHGNGIKDVGKLEVYGSLNAYKDVRIKPNTNREYLYKLSDAIHEALDGTFKNRIVVTDMEGETFTEQFQAAIDMCPDNGVVFIPKGEHELILDEAILIEKDLIILGDMNKADITITSTQGFIDLGNDANNLKIKNLRFYTTGSEECDILPYEQSSFYNIDFNFTVENCEFYGSVNIGTWSGGHKLYIKDCYFNNKLGRQEDQYNDWVQVVIVNTQMTGLCINYSEDIIIDSCEFLSIKTNAIVGRFYDAIISNSTFSYANLGYLFTYGGVENNLLCINCYLNGAKLCGNFAKVNNVTLIGCDTDFTVDIHNEVNIEGSNVSIDSDGETYITSGDGEVLIENGTEIELNSPVLNFVGTDEIYTDTQKLTLWGASSTELSSDEGVSITSAEGFVGILGQTGINISSPTKVEAISDTEIFLATNDGTTESGYGSEIKATNERLDISGQAVDISAVGGDLNLISTGDTILDVTYDGVVRIDAPLKYGTPVQLNSYFSTIPIINSDGVERYILVGTNLDMLTDLANSFAVKITDDGEGNVAIDGLRVKNYDVLSAEYELDTYRINAKAIMTVVTSNDVDSLIVTNAKGNEQSVIVVSKEEVDDTIVWTLKVQLKNFGEQTHYVTGYGYDGSFGISASDTVAVTLN